MIIDLLKTSLANHIESSLTVNGYHWNVEGINFTSFHAFFGEIYQDYYNQVDTLAEYVRVVSDANEYVNGSVDIVKLNKTVSSDPIVGDSAIKMCDSIYLLNNELIKNINDINVEATKKNLIGLSNYCAERINILEKLKWKLLAITKTTGK